MKNFNITEAKLHLNKLLTFYNIEVKTWSKSSCGVAWENGRRVKIPEPTNVDRLCVALHEIGHIRNGFKGLNYIQEYNAEQYAINEATRLGYNTDDYEDRAKWYIIMNICKGFRRKLKVENIPQEIKDWCGIDFDKWEEARQQGLKPWVYLKSQKVKFI